MNASEVVAELEKLGTPQNRKVYSRHGVREPLFGVSYANLGKLRKKIGTDSALARELWKSGNHDARVLATLIADPAALDDRTLDAWGKDLRNYVITDAFTAMVARSPGAGRRMRVWAKSRDEWLCAAGWGLVSHLVRDGGLDEAESLSLLGVIEGKIHGSKNRVRHAMNIAVISIGLMSPRLEKSALAAAARIGRVEVDHGDTGCKTPDAAAYIARTKERKKARVR